MTMGEGKVLLIGWDAADWKIVHRLVDEGKMPNMEKFIAEGVIGNLATLVPELSPMLWTSIATGKRPYKHGILGFTEPDPQGEGLRPITNLSRKTKAIWNILGQSGKKCNVVSWWPSHPVEPINGVMVSNHYQRAVAPYGKPWPMKPETVHPGRIVRNLAALRVHPQELDVGLVMNFVRRLAEIDQEKDRRVEVIAKTIADCTTVSRAASALMTHEPWDLTAVYFDSIDHFCHGFMNFYPPRLPWVDEKDFELYKDVVEGGYIYHDILLGTLLGLVDDRTTVLIISDHGFHSDHLRPRQIPIEPAGPAVQHRHYGILAIKGPGIVKDEIVYGASLLDITPTVLTLFGLPVGEDMDGKPLVNIFRTPPAMRTVPSWDEVPGADGSHPPGKKIDPVEAKEAINQLIELGYIEKPDENRAKAAEESVRELRYNEARSLMDGGLYLKAAPILRDLLGTWPDEYRFGIQLVDCYQSLGRIAEARSLLETLFARKKENARKAAGELKKFREEHKDVKPEDMEPRLQRKARRLRAESSRSPYAMEYLMGSLLFAEGKEEEALGHLEKAEKADRNRPAPYLKIGEVYLKMKRYLSAEKNFRKALSIDPENADAQIGLGKSFLGRGKNADAAEAALEAVGLRYHNPAGHYLLGVALHRLGRLDQALQALHVAISQNPCYPEAHRRLAQIYRRRLKDDALAERHAGMARESAVRIKGLKKGEAEAVMEKEEAAKTSLLSTHEEGRSPGFSSPEGPVDLDRTVVVVSGLPRTGTSMMMQMLKAGGIPPLTDGVRMDDEDNPRGYYEYEKAKQLRKDASWLGGAKGKAVKVVAQLLADLPRLDGAGYLVVFMEREIEEVLKSQRAMLSRHGKSGAKIPEARLRAIFLQQMRQAKILLSARKIPTVFIDYNETVRNPSEAAGKLKKVFGAGIDEQKMTAAVDPSLKRQAADPKG